VTEKIAVDEVLLDALRTVHYFVAQTTGEAPTKEEIAGALKRYFVLNEIMEHIVMDRENH